MKYFNPSYWFKLWLLSAPLFNDKTQGINAKSIDNQNIKDWASKNTSDISLIENQELTLSNNQTIQLQNNENIQSIKNLETDHFYENFLKTQGWSKDEQIAGQQLQEIQEEHHHFLKEQHEKIRNKRNFYEKEKIEFINNDFFYKFDVNYNSGTIEGPISSGTETKDRNLILIKNWTKYAKNWSEFQEKFPEIEIINLRSELGGQGDTVVIKDNNFKLKTSLNDDQSDNRYKKTYWYSADFTNSRKTYYDATTINLYNYDFILAHQYSCNFIRLVSTNTELKMEIFFTFKSTCAVYKTFGSLKFDSIRLVGKVDMNPLLRLTIEKSKQFDIWATSSEQTLKLKREDINYNRNILVSEEVTFKADFISRLLQIRHDYIQDIINIGQDNKITKLKNEIEDIKSRLDNLEAGKTCLENIFDSFKTNTLSDAPGDSWKSIKENSESPLKVIIKKSGKSFATGLLTGLAKGSALGILSCVADSFLSSRKRREIFDINKLEEKNITKWNDEFTKDINHEQHLPIDNKTNFVTSNITSL